MGQKLSIGFKDINGQTASTNFWVNDALTAVAAIQPIANLSNAQVVSAFMVETVDLATEGLVSAAGNGNVETARQKLFVRMSGPDAGSVARPRAIAIVNIPAPVGTIVNGLEATLPNALLTPFISLVRSASDVAMDRIDRAAYKR